ncbi:MAG TPA: EF-hand domain-containing protein [Sphingomicrobium sp.]|nr:EF-hand domain-containing protein [Sphingomicrobium sp.]
MPAVPLPFKGDTDLVEYPHRRVFEWEVIMKEFLVGAAAIVIAGAAFAQVAPTTPPSAPQVAPLPERIDTRDEVVGKVRDHFAQLDANKDGVLTRDEAEAGRKVFKERMRSKLGERRVHRMENRDPNAAFDRLDTNKDGAISREEFAQHREQRIERRTVMKDGQAMPGMPHEGMRMHRFGGMMGGHMFDMADANKDDRVTLQEATDAAVRHFDTADANRDGRLTPDERRQMRLQRRAPKAG